jgi:soluble lytic murein transglycosylase-like protein
MPPSADLIALARAAAAAHELDPALVCAVVEQESAWDTHAIRYEPGFRTRYVAPLGLPPTEEVARSISWGLMQVMGQVAREHGFGGKFLSALCDPAAGLDIGCAVLAAKLASTSDNETRALELWNGGANADYAPQVLARMAACKSANQREGN